MKSFLLALVAFSANATITVDSITTSEFGEFLELGDVVFKQAYLERGEVTIGKVVQATNYGNDAVCIITKLSNQRNVRNEFINKGRMVLPAGATLPLGGFTQIHPRKSWYTQWRHIATKNLNRCQ
jgi:hypothetical protein